MSALTFTLKKRPKSKIDLSPLTPDKLAGHNINAIRTIKLHCSGEQLAVRDLFDVSGDETEEIHFRRSSKMFERIGCGMSHGNIEIRGHGGDYLGKDMTGGHIKLQGDSGDFTGTGMSGGRIDISGNAGDFTGAALPDQMHGMSNGTIIVAGNSGNRTGDRMRRGMIIVLGNSEDYTGSRMIAGTILVLGRSGKHCGHGMRRGTIVIGKKPVNMGAAFNSCGKLKMEFLRLLYKQIAGMGRQLSFFKEYGPEVHRFAGDLSVNGKGEILVMLTAV